MILIVASTKDVAGMNIAKHLINNGKLKKTLESFQQNPIYFTRTEDRDLRLVFINQETIWAQFLTAHFSPELLVFVSKHSGVAGIPTLSVHTPGNLTAEAAFGGLPRKVSVSPASAMKTTLLEMIRQKEEMNLSYEVSYECTHHGPSLDVPTMFAELGSSPDEWKDAKAAEVVARAVIAAVSKPSRYTAVLGSGGPHYNARFTKIALSTPVAFGHIIPKYAVPHVDVEIVKQCLQKTLEKVHHAVFDWKGMKGVDRERLTSALKEFGVPVEKG